MTASFPAFVPEEWAPTKMTRKQYSAEHQHLTQQLAAAEQIVEAFASAFSKPVAHPSLPIAEAVGSAWNAAHDAVTAIGHEIAMLDRAWGNRNVDPYQRYLVSNNID